MFIFCDFDSKIPLSFSTGYDRGQSAKIPPSLCHSEVVAELAEMQEENPQHGHQVL